MKASVLRLIGFLLFPAAAFCQVAYDHHVIFDNSLADRSFYDSRGSLIAPSQLELIDGKIPVDDQTYFTPPNSLRLKWQSRREAIGT